MKINRIRKLKTVAMESLSSCWGECVAIFIVTIGLMVSAVCLAVLAVHALCAGGVLAEDIPDVLFDAPLWLYIALAVFAALFYLLLVPLKYGVYWFCYQAVRGKPVPASCFFSCYTNKEHFFKTIRLNIAVQIIRTAASAPMKLLAAAEVRLVRRVLEGGAPVSYTAGAAALLLLTAGAAALALAVLIRYIFIPYIYINNPSASIKQIFAENRRCMSGGSTRYVVRMIVSFAGWIAAGVFIFPFIFAVPYFLMTCAALAKEIAVPSGKNGEKEETSLA